MMTMTMVGGGVDGDVDGGGDGRLLKYPQFSVFGVGRR